MSLRTRRQALAWFGFGGAAALGAGPALAAASRADQKVLAEEIYPVLLRAGSLDQVGHYANYPEVMQDVGKYRAFIDTLDPLKNVPPYPKLAAYQPEVQITPSLKASIAVPLGKGPFPLMVQCHGNAGRAGSPRSYRRYSQDLAAMGMVVVTPDYRLAPENPAEAALEDCRAAVLWARDHIRAYQGDIARLAITGDSAGGGLSGQLVLSLMADAGAPKPKVWVGTDGFYQQVVPQIRPGMKLPQIILTSGSADFSSEPTLNLALALRKAGHDFELHLLDSMPHDSLKFPHLQAAAFGKSVVARYLRERL
jgi:acetyl esterase/lipase